MPEKRDGDKRGGGQGRAGADGPRRGGRSSGCYVAKGGGGGVSGGG